MKIEEEYHFRGQQPGERVVIVSRQHPFTLIQHAVKVIALLLLAVLLIRSFGWVTWVSLGIPLLVLMSLIIALRSWYGWWSTMVLLTNRRVVFVQQRGFTSRKVSEALLENIQFVTHEIDGLVHTLFNFGDIRIQTAGSAEMLLLNELSDPYELQQRITQLQRPRSFSEHNDRSPADL